MDGQNTKFTFIFTSELRNQSSITRNLIPALGHTLIPNFAHASRIVYLASGLFSTFQKRKPSRQTIGGFINDINFTWEQLIQEKIQNAIDLQPKIMEAIIAADGGHTNYMSSESVS